MTETFNYRQIKEEYGIDVLQQIRTFENISKKKGRYVGHLHFYLQCKHKELVPKGIKIKAQMNGYEARKILEKAEKALLNIRIGEVVRKNKVLDKKKIEVNEALKEKLPERLHNRLMEINEERQKSELEKCRTRQKRKYKNLLEVESRTERTKNEAPQETQNIQEIIPETDGRENQAPQERVQENSFRENVPENNNHNGVNSSGSPESEIQEENGDRRERNLRSEDGDEESSENAVEETIEEVELDATIPYTEEGEASWSREDEEIKERWVKNVSSRNLSKHEIDLLRKGGGFAVTPRELPHLDFITATECACRNLAKGEALSLRAEIVEELGKAKVPASNLTKEEWKAMKKLKEDEDIVVLPADKGKCLVVMDKEEYIKKMEEKLDDQTTYKRIVKDPTEEIKTAISKQLNKIKDEGQIDSKTYFNYFLPRPGSPGCMDSPRYTRKITH